MALHQRIARLSPAWFSRLGEPTPTQKRPFRRLWFERVEARSLFSANPWEPVAFPLPQPFDAEGEQVIGEYASSPHVTDVAVPDGPVRSLSITFSQAMDLSEAIATGSLVAAIHLKDAAGNPLSLADLSLAYDAASDMLVVQWQNPLDPGTYSLQLDATKFVAANKETLASGWNGEPFHSVDLASPVLLQGGDTTLRVDGYSVPTLADWNNDGMDDLVVGEKTTSGQGMVRVYLGDASTPTTGFREFFYASAVDGALAVPGSGCMGSFPRMVDWDNDGDDDLLVGWSDGRLQLWTNSGDAVAPRFGEARFLQIGPVGAKIDIDVGERATFDFADWNGDGRRDLVAGGMNGNIHVFLDRASSGEPDYQSDDLVMLGNLPLVVPTGRASVDVADLNADGMEDLVVGNTEGQLLFYPNVGSSSVRRFVAGWQLNAGAQTVDLDGSARSRPWLGDANSDGKTDVLLGAADGLIRFYAGTEARQTLTDTVLARGSQATYVHSLAVVPASPVWQNPVDSQDVDNDGFVAPLDALLIINELNAPILSGIDGHLPEIRTSGAVYCDVNGDNYVSPTDVLMIINSLNEAAESESDPEFAVAVSRVRPTAALPNELVGLWHTGANRSRRHVRHGDFWGLGGYSSQ